MPHTPTRAPPADGGYPADSDLHRMSDDGGPVGPDPARWADPGWQDRPAGVTLASLDLDCSHVRLSVPGAAPVFLGPYHTPAVARDTLAALQAFLAAARAAPTGDTPTLAGHRGSP